MISRPTILVVGCLVIGAMLGACTPEPEAPPDAPAPVDEIETEAVPEPEQAEPEAPTDLWRFETGGEIWSTPTIRDGAAFVGSDDRRLYAIDVDTGEQLWRSEPLTGAVRSKPAVDDQRVVIIDEEGAVAAYSLGGEPVWQVEAGARFSAASDGDGVIIVAQDGPLKAGRTQVLRLSASDGQRLWQRAVQGLSRAPEADAGRVVLASSDGSIQALESSSGRPLWQKTLGDGAAARLAAGTVYAVGGGFLYALRAADGAERWRLWTSEFLAEPPTVGTDTLVAAAGDGELWGIEADSGLELWRQRLSEPLRAPPALSTQAAVLGAGDHLFLTLDPENGLGLWRFETDATMTRALAMTPGRLVFGTTDDAVYGVTIDLPPESLESTPTPPVAETRPWFREPAPELLRSVELGERGLAVVVDPVTPGEGPLYVSTRQELMAFQDGRERWRTAATSAPTVLGDGSLAVSDGGALKRLGANGRELWRVPTLAVPTPPTAGDGAIVVSDDTGRLWSLGASDGRRLWRQQTAGLARQAAVVHESVIYVGQCPSGVLAVDRTRGRELWRSHEDHCVVATPLPIGDAVYAVQASGEVLALDAAVGGVRWRAPLGGGGRFAPASVFDMLHVVTDDGVLHALDLISGLETWRADIGPRPSTPTVLLDGIAHVGSHDGRIYAVNALNGDVLWDLDIESTPMAMAVEIDGGERLLHTVTFDGRLLSFDLH